MLNNWKKILLLLPAALLAFGASSAAWAAPYEGYNYSWRGEAEPAPVPYLPQSQISGESLGIGSFNNPDDLFITEDKKIYVLDTDNNRIVQMDERWNVSRTIESFANNGAEDGFSSPKGIFVHRNGHIFVADTGNKRIVELNPAGELERIIGEPKADILPQNFVYNPIKLVVDAAGRLYVVAKGVFDGIMQFDAGGKFIGFMGVNKVKYNAIDLFWKRVMTKEQRSKMVLFVPVEFNNVDIDDEGFIYATTAEMYSSEPVKRLNPSGVDVLKRTGYFHPVGDIRFSRSSTRAGPSSLAGVTVDQSGVYSIFDNTRGKIFTYDRDGKLLYVFGQFGEQTGTFKTFADLDMLDDKVVVLDKGMNQLVVFEPTLYGRTVRNAVIMTDTGRETEAVAAWSRALSINNNLEIAYLGIGKAELRQGNNGEAMRNFKLGMHREYYSRAFERYRKEFLWDHFGKIAIGLLSGAIILVAATRLRKARKNEPGVAGMAWYTLFHPFKGFWELKYERKGKVWFALLLLFILCFLYVLKRRYTGFIFNPVVDVSEISTIDEIKFILIPFFLWCIANWSLTTLMDGEGKFKEIVMATAYAMVPIALVQLPLILLSNMITIQEGSFYRLLESAAFVWFFGLLFVGMLTVHQYTVTKTIATMILTLIVIGIIVFLGLLFFSLSQQMLSFGTTIYKEIVFRLGEG